MQHQRHGGIVAADFGGTCGSDGGAFPAPVTGAKKHREQDTGIGPTLRAVAAALLVVVVVLLLLLLVVVVLLLLPPWAMYTGMCLEKEIFTSEESLH